MTPAYRMASLILSDHHNEISYWIEDTSKKKGRPLTYAEVYKLIVGNCLVEDKDAIDSYISELDDEFVDLNGH